MRDLKALDGFSGLGGWSDGLAAEGFQVQGIEIHPKVAAIYAERYPVIVADFRTLNPQDFKGFDLIVGSPPCRDFSDYAHMSKGNIKRWKVPADPNRGLELVKSFTTFVLLAEPRYWLLENVPRLAKYIGKPRMKTEIAPGMVRCFWGNFPNFLMPKDLGRPVTSKFHHHDFRGIHHYESWERAKIPMPLARALGRAVREAIEN